MATVSAHAPASTTKSWPAAARLGRWTRWFALLLVSLPTLAVAQQYQADPVDEKARVLGLSAQNLVKDPSQYAASRARFLEFFNTYYFPAMTRFSASDLAELGKMRYELFSKFLWPTSNAELQADLTKMAHDKMKPVAFSKSKNYHPAVRYNAILILGMLDEQYPIDTGGNRRPSKPLKDSNALLTQLVDYAAKGNAVDPTMLVGALVGLERHAQFHDTLDREAPAAMTAALLKLAAVEPLVPQADSKVAEWIRVQTAIVLAKLGTAGPKGEVHAALIKMLSGDTEPKLSIDARCQVAALLGSLNYQGATVDGKATADAVLKLVSEVVAEELKEVKSFEQLHLGSFNEGPRPKGRMKFDENRQPVYERRTLLTRLSDVRRAVEATKPIVPAEQQATFDAVLAAMKPVIDAAANKEEIDLQLAQKIGAMSADIQRAINPAATPAPAQDTGDLF